MVVFVVMLVMNGFVGMKFFMFKSCVASCENAILFRYNKIVSYNIFEW